VAIASTAVRGDRRPLIGRIPSDTSADQANGCLRRTDGSAGRPSCKGPYTCTYQAVGSREPG
jgi:hypothetical protein